MIDKSEIKQWLVENGHKKTVALSVDEKAYIIGQCFNDLQPKCRSCKHWTRSKVSDNFLPEDEEGVCTGLTNSRIDIELKTGWEGGYIDTIETNHDFLCANFEPKPEPPK